MRLFVANCATCPKVNYVLAWGKKRQHACANFVSNKVMLQSTADSLNFLPRSGINMMVPFASTMSPMRNLTGAISSYLVFCLATMFSSSLLFQTLT
jgi:hypothetical protein